jgi:hypothetical protein
MSAARALTVGDPMKAADIYAGIGSRPDEADARLAAARLFEDVGATAQAEEQRTAARSFVEWALARPTG